MLQVSDLKASNAALEAQMAEMTHRLQQQAAETHAHSGLASSDEVARLEAELSREKVPGT